MSKVTLKPEMKRIIMKNVGLSVEEIVNQDFSSIETLFVGCKKRRHITFPKGISDHRLLNRGSVYLSLGRIIDIKKRDKKLSRI